MTTWSVSAAGVLGRDHAAFRRGAQDAHASGDVGDGTAYGVVCDGCGEGERSEVGAGLAAAYLGAELARQLRGDAALDAIVARAVAGLVELLATITAAVAGADGAAAASGFVRRHLLCTAVGFCVRGDEGVVFRCGDGLAALGDEVSVFDEDNRPSYPAYGVLGAPAPVAVTRFRADEVARIAVATDGFDAELLPGAFGRRGRELQRWMQVCARGGHFRDDATIVVAERAPAPSG